MEYKNTSHSKFTFTDNEIRIKISNDDIKDEIKIINLAKHIYALLIKQNWNKQTLRALVHRKDNDFHPIQLKSHNKKCIYIFQNNELLYNKKLEQE